MAEVRAGAGSGEDWVSCHHSPGRGQASSRAGPATLGQLPARFPRCLNKQLKCLAIHPTRDRSTGLRQRGIRLAGWLDC